ncbi:uncharacterized protein N7496_008151 [Penicillium cataractarum]|uniref:Uncharacterized protein n=1 Tax=Penicillium cataractarum TaxID=2100454 RepID=A0A9W9RY74_9EURO|nr:uncharacterized protein N7496_008151 [Penicillium cataractarum]KAJ5368391.1 hypothetical protein N7496_008151 [Penicillium cataractarum]
MHTSAATLLTLLIPATLAIPRILTQNSGIDASMIPSEVLYYYRYHHIPLDVYIDGLTNDMLLDEDQDAVTKAINEMACGPNKLNTCPSLQWYCNPDMGRCNIKKLIGEMCDSDNSCFSGNCRSRCMKPDGQFGARCIDDTRCAPGLVCRYGLYNRDHRQCLNKRNRIYGVSCTDNNDCENPLVCNEVTIGGARNICSLQEDLTGSVTCINNGELCGADSQCCSNKCQVTATSRMPRCMA